MTKLPSRWSVLRDGCTGVGCDTSYAMSIVWRVDGSATVVRAQAWTRRPTNHSRTEGVMGMIAIASAIPAVVRIIFF